MKRLFSFTVVLLLAVSIMTNTVSAVSYTDLRPTYVDTSDYWYYINNAYDDGMERRANCYGYAIRLHYIGVLHQNNDFYGQVPGEFANREALGIDCLTLCSNFNFSTLSVFGKVIQDCEELGYTVTSLCASTDKSYVPPSASSDPTKRLIAVVGQSSTVLDYHFLIQGSDNTWSQKMGINPASNTCVKHTSVQLNNNNISQHIRCRTDGGEYGDVAIFFYVDVPGTTDMGHYYGDFDSYQTYTCLYEDMGTNTIKSECAGNVMISAEPVQEISSKLINGYINHLNDVDYFIFNVTETGYYTLKISTNAAHKMVMLYGDVTNTSVSSTPSFMGSCSTLNLGQASVSVQLTTGRRYCLKIYSTNQTTYGADRYYIVNIKKT